MAKDYDNANLMILWYTSFLGHRDWRKGQIKIFAVYPEDTIQDEKSACSASSRPTSCLFLRTILNSLPKTGAERPVHRQRKIPGCRPDDHRVPEEMVTCRQGIVRELSGSGYPFRQYGGGKNIK